MKFFKKVLTSICFIFGISILFAQQADKTHNIIKSQIKESAETVSPDKINWEERAALGSDGNITYYATDGVITAIYVIGMADVPKNLPNAAARSHAERIAKKKAEAALAYWLCQNTSFKETDQEKVLVVYQDKKESSEQRVSTVRVSEQTATLFCRGLQTYMVSKTKLKEGVLLGVWRWTLGNQESAKRVEESMKNGNISDSENATPKKATKHEKHEWYTR